MATWKPQSRKKRKASTAHKGEAPLLEALGTPPTADEVPMMLAARENALDALGFELQPAQLVEAVRRASHQADTIRLSVLQSAKKAPACSLVAWRLWSAADKVDNTRGVLGYLRQRTGPQRTAAGAGRLLAGSRSG